MRVRLLEQIRTGKPGNYKHHQAEEVVNLKDEVAKDLIARGRAEEVERQVQVGLNPADMESDT